MATKKLYNTIDRRILKDQIAHSNVKRVTISFYKYWPIRNVPFFRNYLYDNWSELDVLGRIYVAGEGINAQLNVPEENFERFVAHLYSISILDGVRLNIAVQQSNKSFFKLIIKQRKKIVADGIDDPTFDPSNTGVHLGAEAFNELTSKPDTILVDMRNHYESEVGHFKGAICPDADTFREEIVMVEKMLEGKQDKNIVMYCTGGIRCEKASAYLKYRGFPNVHQLEGGIIKYARDVKSAGLENKFLGVNFVFDERMAERISGDVIGHCHQCGEPHDLHKNCRNEACHILFIQCPKCAAAFEDCCSDECRHVANLPEEEQRALRKQKRPVRNIYRKGRGEQLRFKAGTEIQPVHTEDVSPS
ncbi:MAG: rhodanese-related sulfurtransferase [Flavobacteriales bacterium]|nr:rhodanese-related sulfurtransferase [Flavobacteriales bacterium]